MPTSLPRILRTLALLGITLPGAALAHQIWLEPAPGGAKLYFGEFGENLRETSPGRLDKFVSPAAQELKGGERSALTLQKTGNAFVFTGASGKGAAIVAEDKAYPITERKEGDKPVRSVFHPAARLITGDGAQSPALTLDLVPLGKPGKATREFQVIFKDQPLPKAKLTLATPSGWHQDYRSDENGRLSISLPWRGAYVLELRHQDNTPGNRNGEAFDLTYYATTATLVQSTGLAPLPAVPAVAPKAP